MNKQNNFLKAKDQALKDNNKIYFFLIIESFSLWEIFSLF